MEDDNTDTTVIFREMFKALTVKNKAKYVNLKINEIM